MSFRRWRRVNDTLPYGLFVYMLIEFSRKFTKLHEILVIILHAMTQMFYFCALDYNFQ